MKKQGLGIWPFLRRHAVFTAALAAGMVWLAVLAAGLFRPAAAAQYTPAELTALQPTLADTVDAQGARTLADGQDDALAALLADAGDGGAVSWLETTPQNLPAGLYACTIQYRAEYTADGAGTLAFVTANGSSNCPSVPLRGGADVQTAQTRCWLSSACDGVAAVISLKTAGLSVESIQLQEVPSWRAMRLLGAALTVLLAALLWLALMPDGPFRLSARRRVLLAALLGIVALTCLPVLWGSISFGFDLEFHLSRICGIADGLRSGQFPVRIYPGSLNGYGYASPVFYGDLFLYLPAVLYLLGMPLFSAYNFYLVAVNALTAGIAFYCLYKIFRSTWLAGAGSVLYATASYRIFNMYYRPALGECSAQTFLPLLAYGFWAVLARDATPKQRKNAWIPLALGFSGILQTHIITTEITILCAVVLCLALALRTFRRDALTALAKGAAATVALNLWFLVPLVDFMRGDYNCTDATVVFDSASSALSLAKMLGVWSSDMWQMRVGLGLTLGAALYLFCRIRWQALPAREGRLGLVGLVGGGITMIVCTGLFPWNRLEDMLGTTIAHYLCAVQFPFRYLGVCTMFLVLTAVCALGIVQAKKGRTAALVCGTVLCAASCLLAAMDCGVYVSGVYGTYRPSLEAELSDGSKASGLEYLPTGFAGDLSLTVPDPGDAALQSVARSGCAYTITAENPSGKDTAIELPLTYYPGYVVTQNTGSGLSVTPTQKQTVAVVLPAGYSGTFTVDFRERLSWRAAEAVSALSAAVLLVYALRRRKKREKASAPAAPGGTAEA
jgi:hypothetical protein